MPDEELRSLTDDQLEECLTEAISRLDAAQKEYSENTDNIGGNPGKKTPQASANKLKELTTNLEDAEAYLSAVGEEKARRGSRR